MNRIPVSVLTDLGNGLLDTLGVTGLGLHTGKE